MLFNLHSLGWSGSHSRLAIVVFICNISFASFPLSAKPVVPVLTSDTQLATAGYYQLSWQPGIDGASLKNTQFILQQASHADFEDAEIIYHGPDRASVISGLPDGQYYYRVRDSSTKNAWSNSIVVDVTHHSLSKAMLFFIIGATVFFATFIFIMIRSRQYSKI